MNLGSLVDLPEFPLPALELGNYVNWGDLRLTSFVSHPSGSQIVFYIFSFLVVSDRKVNPVLHLDHKLKSHNFLKCISSWFPLPVGLPDYYRGLVTVELYNNLLKSVPKVTCGCTISRYTAPAIISYASLTFFWIVLCASGIPLWALNFLSSLPNKYFKTSKKMPLDWEFIS